MGATRPKDINDAADAALALSRSASTPISYSARGCFNASFFAACILPLSTVFTVCEGLGFESGVDKRLHEAPGFLLALHAADRGGGGVVLWPNFPLVKMILLSQVLNGVLLPVVLIYMIMLINKKGLMKEWTNTKLYNAVAWVSVIIMIGLTLALASFTLKQMLQPAGTAEKAVSKPLAQVQSHHPGSHPLEPDVLESHAAHLVR